MRFPRKSRGTCAALLALCTLVLILVGCIRKARLYNLTTGEVVPVQFTYSGSGKGKLSAVSAAGERFTGEYVTLAGGQIGWGTIYASVYSPKGSASGSSTSVTSSTEAKQHGTAIATGDKGTIIQCEYITSAWNGAGSGGCKDNHDVLYKLMF
jgi:hypothetical protein